MVKGHLSVPEAIVESDLITGQPNTSDDEHNRGPNDNSALRTQISVTNVQDAKNVRHDRKLNHIKKPVSNM